MVFPFRYAQEGGSRASRGFWENIKFCFRGSEMPFPMFSRGKFHKSKHEKTLTRLFSNFVVFLSTFGISDISVY